MGRGPDGEKIRWSEDDRRFMRRWLGTLALVIACVLVALALYAATQDMGRI